MAILSSMAAVDKDTCCRLHRRVLDEDQPIAHLTNHHAAHKSTGGLVVTPVGWDTRTPDQTSRCLEALEFEPTDGALIGTIPFGQPEHRPGICGEIRLTVTPWN